MPLPLVLTLGEPAGIGPELALLAWTKRSAENLPVFYLRGDIELLRQRAAQLQLNVPLAEVTPQDAAAAFAEALPVAPIGQPATAAPGVPDANSAAAAIASIRLAVEDVQAGRASAVVTNPIAKSVLYQAGFAHPGHTEFLAELAASQCPDQRAPQPVMMLWSAALAVVPVTIHRPLRDAITDLSSELIVSTARIVDAALRQQLAIAAPRLAISGLNPHAGEDGGLGTEEQTIITPAIEQLRRDGIDARGPLPADTLFHDAARRSYDCALCMYHDQALIPIKTLAFDRAVNVTLGLPFVRTSPDHGAAFDIAGKGVANPTSLIEALRLAARLARPDAAA